MKKIKLIVLTVLLVTLALSICPMVSSAADVATGLTFEQGDYYETRPKSLMLPSTYEATVCFPSTQEGRGGVIIGTYSDQKVPLFNFEVYSNGAPRIYLNANDSSQTNYDVQFTKVNLFNDKLTHVAITVDHTKGVWSCYVDGQLKQTISAAAPTPFIITSKIRLGGDLREGNGQYFKGVIQKVALYRDIRTPAEIASDATATAFDKDKIICAYDLSSSPIEQAPASIVCAADSGIDFKGYSNWIRDLAEPQNYAYSFALIGDIQNLSQNYPEELTMLYNWLRDNAESKKIKFAVGLGDVTNRNTVDEYLRVVAAYKTIQGVIPFSIVRGNHDRNGTSSFMYDQYITQKLFGDQITGAYDNTMLNTYTIINVGEVKYLFMNLDFLLKNDVLDWANDIIAKNQDCRVIVSTHIYMNYSGKYYTLDGDSGLAKKYGCENNGEDLWNKVLSRHENVIMMICGHNPTDNIYTRTKTGVNGNRVVEMLVDPQTTDLTYNGTGLVAMLYFSEDGRSVQVQYYSTVKDAYFKSNNQFKLTIDVPESTIPETTPPDTTPVETAPAQTAPQNTTPAETEPAVTDILVDDGGCGTVMTSTALLFALAAGGVLIKKKKR